MSATTEVSAVTANWTLALAALSSGIISNDGTEDIRIVQATSLPATTVYTGHILKPGERIRISTTAIQQVYVRGVSGTSKVSVTPFDVVNEYEIVAPSATAQILGATGAAGDYLSHVTFSLIGAVTIIVYDGTAQLFSFTGVAGANYAMTVWFKAKCVTNWNITTGVGVRATAFGDFT